MSKHTPEPWVIWNGGDGIMMYGREPKRGGVALAMCCNELVSGRTAIANARRIVACVNACRGLPTDELEQKGLVAAVGTQLLDVERQRDELLTALDGVLQWVAYGQPDDLNHLDRAHAAIRNAKGGAA
ncbi:hypothetical protein [Aeromonas sp. Prich7-2]|uniref:hypothetical protein n=1 Tax=Aeromonas sp. Prich7-2 TaxID=2823361 RepID=UPI001B31D06D|nr:hypothetical protein [Aeromonas sp. Prich7-2]MBP4059581.1 hypothetical protein [Aeromonas sp. Prich7-2]